jgi:hypothetical protein
VRSSSGGGGAKTRLGVVPTLLLLLLLVAGQVTLLQLVPLSRASSSSSTSAPIRLESYSLTSVLCDSQETTTNPSSPPTTVGTLCEMPDVSAAQTTYLLVVAAALVLFGLFFWIGLSLWR